MGTIEVLYKKSLPLNRYTRAFQMHMTVSPEKTSVWLFGRFGSRKSTRRTLKKYKIAVKSHRRI